MAGPVTAFVAYQRGLGVTAGVTDPLLALRAQVNDSPHRTWIHVNHETGEAPAVCDAATAAAIRGFWSGLVPSLETEGYLATQSATPETGLSAPPPSVAPPTDWQGSYVLVTGASSGIGAATAMLLASRGAHVVAVARRERELHALAENARANGYLGAISPVAADVTHRDSLTHAIADWSLRHGSERFAAVFHCAGSACVGLFDRLHDDQIRSAIDLNVAGTLNVFGLLDYIQDGGSLAVVSSALAHFPLGGASVYSASKRAQHDATEAVRGELGKRGIAVTSVLAGAFNSAIWSKIGIRSGFNSLITWARRLLIASSESAARKMLEDVEGRQPYSYPGTGARLFYRFRNPGSLLARVVRRICPFFFGHN